MAVSCFALRPGSRQDERIVFALSQKKAPAVLKPQALKFNAGQSALRKV